MGYVSCHYGIAPILTMKKAGLLRDGGFLEGSGKYTLTRAIEKFYTVLHGALPFSV
jgi:hypothetical protein